MTCRECGQPMEAWPPSDRYISVWQCWPCKALVVTPLGYARNVVLNVGLSEPQQPQRKD